MMKKDEPSSRRHLHSPERKFTSRILALLLWFLLALTIIAIIVCGILVVFIAFYLERIANEADETFITVLSDYDLRTFISMLGLIVIVVSVIGSCGIFIVFKCLFITYVIILIIVIILEAVLLQNATSMKAEGDYKQKVTERLNLTMRNYNNEDNTSRKAWDFFQREFHCCGIYKADNWLEIGMDYPESCYKNKDDYHLGNTTKEALYENGEKGCREALFSAFSSVIDVILIMFSILCVTQSISIVITIVVLLTQADNFISLN